MKLKRRKPTRYLRMSGRDRLTTREALALIDAATSLLPGSMPARQYRRMTRGAIKLRVALERAANRPTSTFGPRGRSARASHTHEEQTQ